MHYCFDPEALQSIHLVASYQDPHLPVKYHALLGIDPLFVPVPMTLEANTQEHVVRSQAFSNDLDPNVQSSVKVPDHEYGMATIASNYVVPCGVWIHQVLVTSSVEFGRLKRKMLRMID